MSISYETGVASSPTDLLDKLDTFVSAHGWSIVSAATGRIISDGGQIFAGILDEASDWQTRGALGDDTGAAWDVQPNAASVSHLTNWGAGAFTAYHFYVGDEGGKKYVHVTVEVTPGKFRHWALGELVQFGSYTGGVYSDSTYCADDSNNRCFPESGAHRHLADAGNFATGGAGGAAHVWVDYDGKTDNWQALEYVTGAVDAAKMLGSSRQPGLYDGQLRAGAQSWNLRTPLWPLEYFAGAASNLRYPLGRMPNIRAVSMRNFTPGQIITIGSTDWQVFPVFARTDVWDINDGPLSSGYYGYAHRRT